MILLFKRHVNGLGTWRIWNNGNALHIAHATCEGGAEVTHVEYVETNMSGRSMQEQIQLRIQSRVRRQLDKGYKTTRDEALSSTTNQLGLLRPMLAQQFAKVSNINLVNAQLQKKLDGHRCLVTNQDGILPYSRQGKEIKTIEHIINILKDRLPSGDTLDGELYCHGVPLQTIGSWIKRKQDNTSKLWYVVYDLVSPEPFTERYNELKGILGPLLSDKSCPVKLLPCVPYTTSEAMWDFFHDARSKKFEGAMLRTNDRGYQDGIRSSSLIKIKAFEDTEVRVKGFDVAKDGCAICICEYKGKDLRVLAPGSRDDKRKILDDKDSFIDKYLTIEYAYLTNDGIPFQPVAVRWREDI